MAMRYQPQGTLRIERGPMQLGLRMAMLPGVNRSFDPASQRSATPTGVLQNFTTTGLAGGFGATYGTGTAVDKIVTTVGGAFPPNGRGHFFRGIRNGAGGGSLGRLFDKTNGSAGQFLYWYGNGSTLAYGFYAGGNEQRVNIPTAGQVIGALFDLYLTHDYDGSTHTINAWVGNSQVVTNWTLTASNNDAASTPFTIGNRNSDNIRSWDGLIECAYIWDGARPWLATPLRVNRYAVFADPYEEDEFVTVPSAVTRHTISGSDSAQVNSSAPGVVTQHHKLAAALSSQVNSTSVGAVTNVHHRLVGSNSSQVNTAPSVATIQHHKLAAALSNQINAASAGAAGQRHAIQGTASNQVNVGSAGPVSQHHKISGAVSSVVNSGGIGRIAQHHLLVGSQSFQVNSASVAALNESAVMRHTLAAVGGNQVNTTTSGAAVQHHKLAASASNQVNSAPAVVIAQHYRLAGADVNQVNQSTSGRVGAHHAIVGTPSWVVNGASVASVMQRHILVALTSLQVNGSPSVRLPGARYNIDMSRVWQAPAEIRVYVSFSESRVYDTLPEDRIYDTPAENRIYLH